MTAAKKTTPPPLELPPRPPSKVEQGLAKPPAAPPAEEIERAADDTPEAKRERAIAAMVEAGLSREFAEGAFVLAADDDSATPADVADAVAEAEDYGAPLCKHGCHGPGWKAVPAHLDGVGCEHGSFTRKPSDK